MEFLCAAEEDAFGGVGEVFYAVFGDGGEIGVREFGVVYRY
jgi:hypothetical protein